MDWTKSMLEVLRNSKLFKRAIIALLIVGFLVWEIFVPKKFKFGMFSCDTEKPQWKEVMPEK